MKPAMTRSAGLGGALARLFATGIDQALPPAHGLDPGGVVEGRGFQRVDYGLETKFSEHVLETHGVLNSRFMMFFIGVNDGFHHDFTKQKFFRLVSHGWSGAVNSIFLRPSWSMACGDMNPKN